MERADGHRWAVPTPVDGLSVLTALREALNGGRPLMPYAEVDAPPAPVRVPKGTALVVGTSGSTGTPKRAILSAAAVRASGLATQEALGGQGRWLLALPAQHIAGLQVLARSVLAGTTPLAIAPNAGADELLTATRALGDGAPRPRRYVSIVPAQLARWLAKPAGVEALTSYDAVLVGGAATDPGLLQRARDAGVSVVTTYGMSETAGGCVYDGVPLPGARFDLADGRVRLAGPMLADGYVGVEETTDAFVTDPDGTRWFVTGDLGHVDDTGRLVIDGRADDIIVTAGYKVHPLVVEQAVRAALPVGTDVCAVGIPDPTWGAVVAVALSPAGPQLPDDAASLRTLVADRLPTYAIPRRVVVLAEIPTRGPGKPDRRAVLEILREAEAQVRTSSSST